MIDTNENANMNENNDNLNEEQFIVKRINETHMTKSTLHQYGKM